MTKITYNGAVWPSSRALAEAVGVNPDTFRERCRRGVSLEVALCAFNLHHVPARDHTGAEFPTVRDMCRHWGVPPQVFRARYYGLDWSLERALTAPVRGRSRAVIVNGVAYGSLNEAARALGVKPPTVYARIRSGVAPVDALTALSARRPLWYKGRRYATKAELARSLRISATKVNLLEGLKYE